MASTRVCGILQRKFRTGTNKKKMCSQIIKFRFVGFCNFTVNVIRIFCEIDDEIHLNKMQIY